MRVKPTGQIIKTEYLDFVGNIERVKYSLEGGNTFTISLISPLMREGPYRFRVIHLNQPYGEYIVCLDGIKARFLVLLYRSTRWLDFIYRRLLITAAVWRLAEYHDGIPTWHDVYLLNKAERRIRQCTKFLAGKSFATLLGVG